MLRTRRTRKVLMLVENQSAVDDPRVWPEACALRDAGFKVSIICPRGPAVYDASHRHIDGIDVYRYHLPTGNSHLAYIAEYLTALVMTFLLSILVWFRHGFDVMHVANPPDMFFPLALFYRLFGKKFVFDQHDLAPEIFSVRFAKGGSSKIFRHLLLSCERYSYQTAHLVIVTNESFRRVAIERGGCAEAKLVVVRNGPDPRRFTPTTYDSVLLLRTFYQLVFVGLMGIQDGVQYALRAMEVLVHQRGRRDISMVLVGDGPYARTLRALVHQLELDAYVTFTGFQTPDEVARYLATADIGLVPDPLNGLNEMCTMIKTMEYMAAGLPIVAFDLVENRVSAQGAALYATPNDVEEFASRIEDLLADDGLRKAMGALGRRRVEEELSWDYSKEQLLLAYAQLLGTSAKMATGSPTAQLISLKSSPDGTL